MLAQCWQRHPETGRSGSGKFSENAPSAFRNADIDWKLIQVDGRTGDLGTGDLGTGDADADSP